VDEIGGWREVPARAAARCGDGGGLSVLLGGLAREAGLGVLGEGGYQTAAVVGADASTTWVGSRPSSGTVVRLG
jgi:hypothetical protein